MIIPVNFQSKQLEYESFHIHYINVKQTGMFSVALHWLYIFTSSSNWLLHYFRLPREQVMLPYYPQGVKVIASRMKEFNNK